MPYKGRRKYSRKGRGVKLPQSVALLAREAAKSLRDAKVAQELDHLLGAGKLLTNTGRADLYQTYVNPNYRPSRVRGRGAYSLTDAVRGGLSAVAGVGGPAGMAAGLASQIIGGTHKRQAIGSAHGDWYGSGAYTAANQLVNPSGPSKGLYTSGDETNDIILTHKEYLCDVIPSTSAFSTIWSGNQNPGLSGSFPWLSQLAQYFEEYEFIQLLYTFESMVTEGNTNASGTIVMCTQYNPTNALFNNKQQMEMYEHANSFKVTQHAVHGVECDPLKRAGTPAEYIRTGPVPTGQDPKTYDLGVFQMAVSGAYPNLMLGELWVTYTVKLSKAKIPSSGTLPGLPITYAAVNQQSLVVATITNPLRLNTNVPFYFAYDTTNPVNGNQSGFYAMYNGSSTSIYFPTQIETGTYEVEVIYQQVSGTANQCLWTGTNCTANTGYGTAGTTVTAGVALTKVVVNAPGSAQASIQINTAPWSTPPTFCNIVITQLNNSMSNYLLN